MDGRAPAHVTLRVLRHVCNLRSQRSFRVIERALAAALFWPDFRVAHFSVQGNHLHLIVEADDAKALSRGMKSVSGRIARGLNRMMKSRGPVFEDRYHCRALRTPTEVAHALAYVLGNFASHARRRGEELPPEYVDPYASSSPANRHLVSEPHTWLLREGWRRARR